MWTASLVLLVGCELSMAPYVDHVDTNIQMGWRSEATFTAVEVCYNSLTTTPESVRRLAEEACDNEGAQAVFADQRTLQCSLSRPVSAIFVCR